MEKPDRGIRPIAIEDIIYRLAIKAILLANFRKSILLFNQLGVQSPGGVEPAIFILEEAISGGNKSRFKGLSSLDLTNTFNNLDRASIAATTASYAPTFYRAAR